MPTEPVLDDEPEAEGRGRRGKFEPAICAEAILPASGAAVDVAAIRHGRAGPVLINDLVFASMVADALAMAVAGSRLIFRVEGRPKAAVVVIVAGVLMLAISLIFNVA